MNTEMLYTVIVLGIIDIAMLALVFVMLKSDVLYDEENGRWKSGINLPGLESRQGDEVNHKAFKKFVALNTLFLIVAINIPTFIFMGMIDETTMSDSEVLELTFIYMGILFALILIPMVLMFSNFKERFITRVNSTPPKHHKYILITVSVILVATLLATLVLGM